MIDLEIRRQTFHLVFGWSIIALLFFSIINTYIILAMFLLWLAFVFAKTSKIIKKIPLLDNIIKKFDRPSQRYHGVTSFLFGALIATFFFDKTIAITAIAILATGDAASTVFGMMLGRTKLPWNRKKTLEGSLFGFILGTAGAAAFTSILPAILASLAAIAIESIDKKKIYVDDNILMPLAAATVLTIL